MNFESLQQRKKTQVESCRGQQNRFPNLNDLPNKGQNNRPAPREIALGV